MTLDQVWLLLRRTGSPGNLTVALYSDNSGDVDTLLDSSTISAADTADVLMEWMISTVQQSLSNGTYYWLVIYSDSADTNDKHWKVAMQEGLGSYAGASFSSTQALPPTACIIVCWRRTPAKSASRSSIKSSSILQ